MSKQYNIGGFQIPVIEVEACFKLVQYGKGLEITCKCSRCIVNNAGMTSKQIKERMDKANGFKAA